MKDKLYYSLQEFSELMGWGMTSTYNLIRAGKLRMTKIGGKSLISKEDLEAFRELIAAETAAAHAARFGSENKTGKAA